MQPTQGGPTPAGQEFLKRLRSETSEAHEALEQTPISMALTSPTVSLPEYIAYLQAMLPVHLFTEEVVFPKIRNVIPDLDARKKTHLILADLEALGAGPDEALNHTRLVATELDEAGAMGAMYVVEGSALGGRVILKGLPASLGVSPSHGATYFAGYQDATGPMWQRFLGAMLQYAEQPGAASKMISAATDTFRGIHQFFDRVSANQEANA